MKDTGSHYRFTYKGIKLDPARIAKIYEVKEPMQMAILKKCLLAGHRGHKDLIQDLDDIITAVNRWKEMAEEDRQIEEVRNILEVSKDELA